MQEPTSTPWVADERTATSGYVNIRNVRIVDDHNASEEACTCYGPNALENARRITGRVTAFDVMLEAMNAMLAVQLLNDDEMNERQQDAWHKLEKATQLAETCL